MNMRKQVCLIIYCFTVMHLMPVKADEGYSKKFPGLIENKLEYEYIYHADVTWGKVDIPEMLKEIIVDRYDIPPKMHDNVFVAVALEHNNKFLTFFKFQTSGNKSKADIQLENELAQKDCDSFRPELIDACHIPRGMVVKYGAYAIVDMDSNNVVPLSKHFKIKNGIASVLDVESFEHSLRSYISSAAFHTYSLTDSNSQAILGKSILDLPSGKTRRCLAGLYAWLDFNGDNEEEFVLISGDGYDEVYQHQVEPKNIGLVRSNAAIFDVTGSVAVPLLSEELFSYEMDYKSFYIEGVGKGIYRDTKLYWGDFNKDGIFDYLVRRRQASLDFRYKNGFPQYNPQPYIETANLYLGIKPGTYTHYQPENEQDFLDFVLSTTSWEDGFPELHDCK